MQNGAAAIAMDPSTGAILGMVSLGNFDLNNYQKVSDKDQEAIDAETDPDKRSELLTAAQQKQWLKLIMDPPLFSDTPYGKQV